MTTVLKLGGSVITEKEIEGTVATDRLGIIAEALGSRTPTGLVIVIGGGSFGHPAAARHGMSTTDGTTDAAAVSEVHAAMLDLVTQVVDRLIDAGLPAMAVHPLSLAWRDADGLHLAHEVVQAAVDEGFVPVIHGDGVVTTERGVTILSGDELVVALARTLGAERVGLCTGVSGVLDADGTVIEHIERFDDVAEHVGESEATDVTGGMAGKVRTLLELGVPAVVFDVAGLESFLDGGQPGTTIDPTHA